MINSKLLVYVIYKYGMVLLLLVAVSLFVACDFGSNSSKSQETDGSETSEIGWKPMYTEDGLTEDGEEKVFWQDNGRPYGPANVLIVLSKTATLKTLNGKIWTQKDFPEVNFRRIGLRNLEYITALRDMGPIDIESFRVVLMCTPMESGRDEVVKAIRLLEKRIDFIAVNPAGPIGPAVAR